MRIIFTKHVSAYYPPIISFIVNTIIAIWSRYQYLCCDLSISWSHLFLLISTICGGWVGYVYVLKKQGKIS